MSWITLGSAAITAVGSYYGSKKVTPEAGVPAYQPLDIAKVISDARTAASENYANSFALENQYNPGTAGLRTATNSALSNLASGSTPGQTATNSLLSTVNQSKVDPSVSSNPLLKESSGRILANLRLGGTLGADTQATAVQAALEKGGAAGISGSGAARGLVAKDLGLTSLGLENQRIGAAQTAGATQAGLDLQGQGLSLQDYIARLTGAQTAAAADTQRTGLLASIIDGRALPNSGLDPGSVASLYVGNNNAQNQYNVNAAAITQQQKNASLNSMLGLGSFLHGSGASSSIAGGIMSLFKSKTGGGMGGE